MTSPEAGPRPPLLNLTNLLVLLGILVTTVGIVYFATEFIDRLSEWGKLFALILLTVTFVALGAYFEDAWGAGGLLNLKGFRWLRISTSLFLLAAIAGFVTVIFFAGMDAIGPRVKTLVMILSGLGLIGGAAWLQQRRAAA